MDKVVELFRDEISNANNSRDVLGLLLRLKYESIMWFIKRGKSRRYIANRLGLSNTRITQIIKLNEKDGRQ